MPIGTLDRSPPPFFNQGPSALTRLAFFSALAAFLMVADVRFQIVQPLRAAIATVLYPIQQAALLPGQALSQGKGYVTALEETQGALRASQQKLTQQALRAAQVEQLNAENQRLRTLMGLREHVKVESISAEVLYDAPDPYTRKVVVDKGSQHSVNAGAPVVDEAGVLGQVSRVYPLMSEVTLLTDRDHATPVLNTRTGVRSVVFGETNSHGSVLELRFSSGDADVQPGDVLTTSGLDGVYPVGLPVAKVERVERRSDSSFSRIVCTPFAKVNAPKHMLILGQAQNDKPPRPEPEPEHPKRKGARK